MRTVLHRQLSVFLAAVLGVVVGSVGPGVARAAYDAVNADKVDGKHAVSSGASITQRRGKLVATNPTTGLLPSNIIRKAPDSSKLNGYPHSKLRFLSLPVQAAYTEGGATKSRNGVNLFATGDGTLTISVLVPPDHNPNSDLLMDVLIDETSTAACGIYVYLDGLVGPIGDSFYNGGWQPPGINDQEGLVQIPAGTSSGHTITFRGGAGTSTDNPGQVVQFRMSRDGDNLDDTCQAFQVLGLQLRY
jgi:hypothetical protein